MHIQTKPNQTNISEYDVQMHKCIQITLTHANDLPISVWRSELCFICFSIQSSVFLFCMWCVVSLENASSQPIQRWFVLLAFKHQDMVEFALENVSICIMPYKCSFAPFFSNFFFFTYFAEYAIILFFCCFFYFAVSFYTFLCTTQQASR